MQIEGKTVVITGASAGIGAAAAREFHRQGANVLVVGRSPDKTAAVAAEVGTEPLIADFTKLAEVRRLADQIGERCARVDVLCNNAGGTFPTATTEDGHEIVFQVNHLAPYLLTRLLEEQLKKSQARIIATSSSAHNGGVVKLDRLDAPTGMRAYGAAKLENILFTKELQRRWGPDGVLAAAYHPGVVASEFARDNFFVGLIYRLPTRKLLRSNESGADTMVWLATSDGWVPGGYFYDRKLKTPRPAAQDAELAKGLWEKSAEMVGMPAD